MSEHANTAAAPTSASNTPAAPAVGMRSEIIGKWSKFNDAEVTALKSKDDLVTLVQSKYAIDKSQAQRDVDAFAKGRQL